MHRSTLWLQIWLRSISNIFDVIYSPTVFLFIQSRCLSHSPTALTTLHFHSPFSHFISVAPVRNAPSYKASTRYQVSSILFRIYCITLKTITSNLGARNRTGRNTAELFFLEKYRRNDFVWKMRFRHEYEKRLENRKMVPKRALSSNIFSPLFCREKISDSVSQ